MTPKTPYTDFFNDAEQVKNYSTEPSKFMPGYDAMHRMACVLLSEHIPSDGHILVHGAGGGLELENFANYNKHWTFFGVDPAAAMLDEARRRLRYLNRRVSFHHGLIFDAPDKKFDAATSLLTLHFLDTEDRQKTVTDIVRRLKPGAPFIAVHCSYPQDEKNIWLARHRSYAIASGVDHKIAEEGRNNIENSLPVLSSDEDEAILRASGLHNVTQFYSAFTWRGWIGTA